MEAITKSVVQRRVKKVSAPPQVVNCILQKIRTDEQIPTLRGFLKRLRNLLSVSAIRVATAVAGFAVFIIAGIFYFQSQNEGSVVGTGKSDMIMEAVNRYHEFSAGDIALQVKSSDSDEIREFFRGKVNFEVFVPTMAGCRLLGAVLSEFRGIKIIHLVYARGNLIIYICQTNMNEVMRNARFDLPVEAKAVVSQGGWYTGNPCNDCMVVVWRENHTVCSAVARMDKTELMALLKKR